MFGPHPSLILLIVIAFWTAPIARSQQETAVPVSKPFELKQVIYAPFAGITDFANWEIEVANRSDEDVLATVTVYASNGQLFSSSKVMLFANQIQRIDIKKLTSAASNSKSEDAGPALGGIAVAVVAKPMAIAAQVTLTGFHKDFGNIDSILLPDAMFPSNQADAVWWQPQDGHSFLILGNSSANSITANITYGLVGRDVITLGPHSTVMKPIEPKTGPSSRSAILSVHAEGSGPAGTLRVSGYTVSESAGFVNVIRAYDPLTETEPTAYANGLHFSNGDNHLVVKNLTSSPLSVWGTVYPLSTGGPTPNVAIPKVFLRANESAEMDLPAPDESLDNAALKVESSGPNGSFVASYVSHALVGHLTRSMPFKDIGDRANTMGGYPWRLDASNESHTYITNIGKVRGAFGAFISPRNGYRYVIDTHFLDPGETAVIDYRSLRDQQIPDRNGRTLPKDANSGEIQWFPLFFDGSQHFIGRTEVLDSANGVSSSFSCGSCPCSPNVNSAYISPSSVYVPVGGTTSIRAAATMNDPCNINSIPDMTIIPASWSVPPYIRLTSGTSPSVMTGVSPGTGSFSTSYTSPYWVYNPFQNPQCMQQSNRTVTPTGSATAFSVTVTAADIVHDTITVVMAPNTLSATLTLTANGPGVSSTLFQGIEAGNTVNFSFKRPSLPSGQYTFVKATWNVAGSGTSTSTATDNFDVLGIYRHSQYNTPSESSCTGAATKAWVITGSCVFTQTTLKSDFLNQVFVNGSGMSQAHGNLHYTTQCSNYPTGASSQNSFLQVSSITGSCNTVPRGGVDVATFPNPKTGSPTWQCGDLIQLVNPDDTTKVQKSAQDYCPVCNTGFNGGAGHIDDYSSSAACSAHAVGDLGNFLTIRLR